MGTKKATATKKVGTTKKQPTGKKPAPKKLTEGAKSFTVAAVESALGIELTARYRHFLESGEYRKHNHRFVSGVPGLAGKREVVFDAPKLLSMWKTHGVKTSSIIPLAAFAGESELLTIDLRDSAVGVWDEGAFSKFLPSLDALLACLLGKGEKTIREKLSEAIDQATPLNKADKDAAAVKILDAAIGDLTAATVPDDARRELAKALNLRGSSLMGLDREADGLASWEESARCGTRSGHQAILMICENHLDNKQAAKAVEWGERLFALDELKDTHAFFWGKLYLGLGKLLAGDEPAARELLEMIATKFASDVDRRAKAHDALTTYAPESPMASLFG